MHHVRKEIRIEEALSLPSAVTRNRRGRANRADCIELAMVMI